MSSFTLPAPSWAKEIASDNELTNLLEKLRAQKTSRKFNCVMVKFVVEHRTLNGRIGKILRWGDVEIEHATPSCMTYTRAGHIPHLTWDVASKYLENVPTHLTLTDPLSERSMQFNNAGSIAIWTKAGRRSISVAMIKKLLSYSHVSSYETMFDYGTPPDCSNKRLTKAVDRTVKFATELLHDSSPSGAVLIALCGGHSPFHHQRCAAEIGPALNCCGFVLDVMQFAKRHRFGFGKKKKVLKVSKSSSESTSETRQTDSSDDEASQSKMPLDPVVTESEFDENAIRTLLAGVWPHLPPAHLRLANGAFSPTEVLALTRIGVDLFDSSYAVFLSEQGKAFICSDDFPLDPTFSVLDFSDSIYAEDFTPLCKNCDCYTCTHYTKSYLRHLTNTRELLGPTLLIMLVLNSLF
ncbi:unnamed protein product [Gongylonema pulchrum]|uniref:TGT domain-containing protein n=1 Tax=Gongylonema pulchrum TaxID=637853 RepID=A0A183CVC9_9BILA|nr:unnamed protein product [Gongylonema pulchrum]